MENKIKIEPEVKLIVEKEASPIVRLVSSVCIADENILHEPQDLAEEVTERLVHSLSNMIVENLKSIPVELLKSSNQLVRCETYKLHMIIINESELQRLKNIEEEYNQMKERTLYEYGPGL